MFCLLPALVCMLCLVGDWNQAEAFCPVPQRNIGFCETMMRTLPRPLRYPSSRHNLPSYQRRTAVGMGFGWIFGGGDRGEDESDQFNDRRMSSGSSNLGGGLSGIMSSMENLKTSQRFGKMTNSLLQELASITVEGASENGKVKVAFDCQQRPLRVDIDEGFFESASVADLEAAITTAMKEAHERSVERMEDRLKNFYSDLGLPPR